MFLDPPKKPQCLEKLLRPACLWKAAPWWWQATGGDGDLVEGVGHCPVITWARPVTTIPLVGSPSAASSSMISALIAAS